MIYIELLLVFFKQQIKAIMEYKQDFIMGIISVFVQQIGMFLVTIVVFTQVKTLAGFSINEILLLYGFYTLVRGIDHFYNDNIWSFAWNKVRDGSFITMLLRPINPILQIVMEKTNIGGFGEIVVGFLIVIYYKGQIGFQLSFLQTLALIVLILCGLSIYFSIKLLFSAPAFWTTSCGEFMTAGYEMSNSAKYPIEIYNNSVIKNMLLYMVPFPITAYFPTLYCLNKVENLKGIFKIESLNDSNIIIYSVSISLILLIISIKVWNTGLKRYEPTGT